MLGHARILILDDHTAVRAALAARLGAMPELSIVGETGEVDAGLELVSAQRPDIVLVDPKRADGRGLELMQRVVAAGTGARVVVLTSYASNWDRWSTHRSGARQYLLKDIDSASLVAQIRAVLGAP
jgi:DNA-binding NarL/FixJ family response regulator